MNEEKKIAQAILDAYRLHKESWKWDGQSMQSGQYTLDVEDCFEAACKRNKLSPRLYRVLNLADNWHNDLADWAEEILEGQRSEKIG